MDIFSSTVLCLLCLFLPFHTGFTEKAVLHTCVNTVVIGHSSIKGFFHIDSDCVVFGGCEKWVVSGLVILRTINMVWNVLLLW